MASESEIKAGQAYWEMTLKDQALAAALEKINGQMNQFAQKQQEVATQTSNGIVQSFSSGAMRLAGLFGVALSVGALVNYSKSAVMAAGAADELHRKMESWMRSTHQYTSDAIEGNIKLAKSIAMCTKLDKEQVEQLMIMGIMKGLQNKDMETAVKLSIGLADQMQRSGHMMSPQMMMARMMLFVKTGQGSQFFQSQGVNAQGATPEARLQSLMEKGMEGFNNVKFEMGGIAGEVHRTGEALNEFKIDVGKGIVAGSDLADTLEDLTDDLDGTGSEVEEVTGFLGLMGKILYEGVISTFKIACIIILAAVSDVAHVVGWLMKKLHLGSSVAEFAQGLDMKTKQWSQDIRGAWHDLAQGGTAKGQEERSTYDAMQKGGMSPKEIDAAMTEHYGKRWQKKMDTTGMGGAPNKPPPPPSSNIGGIAGEIAGIALAGANTSKISYAGGAGIGGSIQDKIHDVLSDQIAPSLDNIDTNTSDSDPYSIGT
jgi:hypothetical protein